jgi:hypothetical protein
MAQFRTFRTPFPKIARDERGVAYCAPRTKWVVMFAGKCPVRFIDTDDDRKVCELVCATKATTFATEEEASAKAMEYRLAEFLVEKI